MELALIYVKDSQALATAILDLLQNDDLRRQMGAAGRERAVNEFSDERIARQMLDVYQELLNGKWHSGLVASGEHAEALN